MYPSTTVDGNERLRHLMFMSAKRKLVVSFDLEARRWRDLRYLLAMEIDWCLKTLSVS